MLQQGKAPYGDIVYVQTPTIDALSKQLYAEQKQRQMIQYQENKALDEGMRKEFANVRSIDTPEVVGLYNDYKTGKKREYFDKNLRKNPLEFNKVQQDNNSKLQRLYEVINGSRDVKEMAKTMTQDRFKNPDAYADDFGQRTATLMNTPYSQLQNHPQYKDLTNWDQYRYQGSNTDFGKILKDASGTPKDILGKSVPIDKGFQTQTSVFQFGNSPAQVNDQLINSMAMHRTGRDAAYQWDQISPAQVQATVDKYKAIPQEKWEKMGLQAPQDLGAFNDNKAANYAKYLSMNYAINAEPKEGKPIIKENKSAVMAAQEAKDRRIEAIRHADAKDLVRYKKEIDPNDTETNNVWYQSYLDNRIGEANKSGTRHQLFTDKGRSILYYKEIKPDPFLMKALTRGKSEPDRVGVTDDGQIIPIFFKYKSEKDGGGVATLPSGHPIIDDDYSKPMDYDQVLVNLGYRGSTKKQLQKDQQKIQNNKSTSNKHTDPLGLF